MRPAPEGLVESLNRAIRDGSLKSPAGGELDALHGGLVREDGKFLYPIRNGIPIMLIEERIALPPPEGDGGESAENVEEGGDSGHHPVEAGAGA